MIEIEIGEERGIVSIVEIRNVTGEIEEAEIENIVIVKEIEITKIIVMVDGIELQVARQIRHLRTTSIIKDTEVVWTIQVHLHKSQEVVLCVVLDHVPNLPLTRNVPTMKVPHRSPHLTNVHPN